MKLLLAVLWPATLLAHMVSMSTGEITVNGNRAHYELRMPAYEAAHVQDPDNKLLEHIHFSSGGVSARLLRKTCGDQQGTYICTADYEFPAPVDELDIDCTFAAITVPNHVHMLRAFKGDKVDEAVFDLSFTTAQVRFRPPSAWETAARESGAGFLRAVGGFAPLLFLISLTLAARSRRELALLTLALIVGETVACLLAPRILASLSPRFIESAAALTIAYLAFEIVLLPHSGQRWLVVGVLGLIHGAYFSMFLTASGYQFGLFLTGVIMGELLILAVLAFGLGRLLSMVRIPRAVPVAASVLLTVGMIWFFVQLRA